MRIILITVAIIMIGMLTACGRKEPAASPVPPPAAGSTPPAGPEQPDEGLAIGQTAPEITGADQDGTQFKLSDYRGKVVVIDFWGDW